MTEFRDAGVSFFNRLRGNTPKHESSDGKGINIPMSGEVSVNSDHAAFRMFKALSEGKNKDSDTDKKESLKKAPPIKTSPKKALSSIPESRGFKCSRCSNTVRMPEENNDVCCSCGSVYPYKAARALFESQHKSENNNGCSN